MSGAVPPLPNTPSWHGAQFKAQGQLYFLTFSLLLSAVLSKLEFG